MFLFFEDFRFLHKEVFKSVCVLGDKPKFVKNKCFSLHFQLVKIQANFPKKMNINFQNPKVSNERGK